MPAPVTLPQPATRIYERVSACAVAAGSNESQAHAIAMRGLDNAGWVEKSGGWVQIEKRRVSVDQSSWRVNAPIESFTKAGDTLRVYGWASVAVDERGQVVLDHQDDMISAVELEQAAAEYVKSRGGANVMHGGPEVGSLIEAAFFSPEKRVAMGLDGIGKTGLWVGYEIRDTDTIAKVRSGELTEFSIEGEARRVAKAHALTELRITKVALVDRGAGKGVSIALYKRGNIMSFWTKLKKALTRNKPLVDAIEKMEGGDGSDPAAMLESILAKLTPEERTIIELAIQGAAMPEPPAPVESEKKDEPAPEKKDEEMPPAVAKRLAAAEGELAAIRKAERRRGFLEIAKSIAHVPGLTLDEIADMLDGAERTMPSDGYAKLLKSLEAQSKAAETLTEPSGSARRGKIGEPDGDGEGIEAEVVKALAADPKMSRYDAYKKALDTEAGRAAVRKSLEIED